MALLQYRVPALERMMVAFSSLLQESWWSLDPNPSMKLDMQVCQVLLPVLDILLMEEIWRSPVEVGSLSPLLTGFFTIWSDQSPQIKRHPGLRTTMISYMKRSWIMKSHPRYSKWKLCTHLPEGGCLTLWTWVFGAWCLLHYLGARIH